VADWTNAEKADGPKVAAWIIDNVPGVNSMNDPDAARRLRDWHKGAQVGVYALDRVLTRHGLHLSCLPDDVWCEGQIIRNTKGLKRGYSRPSRTWDLPTKYCPCGKEIARKKPSGAVLTPGDYLKREFCCPTCQRKYRTRKVAA
jgi:hypothetical protein